jgi:endonuclease-8
MRLLQANLATVRRSTVGNPAAGGGLAVYGRAGQRCRRCGQPVRSAPQGERARVTYWCPGCQR